MRTRSCALCQKRRLWHVSTLRPQPEEDSAVVFGSVSQPGSYSLGACEWFGREYSSTPPVTSESSNAVHTGMVDYNLFEPPPQLLFERPYVCEDEA